MAIKKLQELWKDLTFAKVDKVVTKDENRMRKFADEPDKWHSYYGFAKNGLSSIYFQRNDFCRLDFDISLTLDFGTWGNHYGGWVPPKSGDLLCGIVKATDRGLRFDKWFVCRPEVQQLICIIRNGATDKSEDELAQSLVSPGYPDQVWAVARLFLFDNVTAFVDQLAGVPTRHPAYGYPTGTVMADGRLLRVEHSGMWLPTLTERYVELLAYHFNPSWWQRFQNEAQSRGLRVESTLAWDVEKDGYISYTLEGSSPR